MGVPVPRQPDDLDALRVLARSARRPRSAPRGRRRRGVVAAAGRGSRRPPGTAVSSPTSSSRRAVPGLELDAAVGCPRRGAISDQPVTDRAPAPPRRSPDRARRASSGCTTMSTTSRVSAPSPRRRAPCRCACGRAPRPGGSSQVSHQDRRRRRTTAPAPPLVREDQLDPLVVERAVDAELGQAGAAELDPDERRREPLDAHHLDLVEDHRQGLLLGRSS